jgi:hypothetical protein
MKRNPAISLRVDDSSTHTSVIVYGQAEIVIFFVGILAVLTCVYTLFRIPWLLISSSQNGTVQICTIEKHSTQVGATQMSSNETGTREIGQPTMIGTMQTGFAQIGGNLGMFFSPGVPICSVLNQKFQMVRVSHAIYSPFVFR